jgi:homocysteine S-methyltransferase
VDLPGFAAFPLVGTTQGRALLSDYYAGYAEVARRAGANLLLETPTWRANPDWVVALGGSPRDVRRINLESVVFLAGLGERLLASGRLSTTTESATGAPSDEEPFEVRGVIGPRGDGYVAQGNTSAEEFADYHSAQAAALCESGASWVTAYTLTTVAEAVGVVQAARANGLRVSISFTVETDGCLPNGTRLAVAVESLWQRSAPDGLLLNCAHPSHIAKALHGNGGWARRVTGLRVNASRQSHAELDSCERLDEGDLDDLVREHEQLAARLPNLQIVGGCCGTDVRHVAALWGVAD